MNRQLGRGQENETNGIPGTYVKSFFAVVEQITKHVCLHCYRSKCFIYNCKVTGLFNFKYFTDIKECGFLVEY